MCCKGKVVLWNDIKYGSKLLKRYPSPLSWVTHPPALTAAAMPWCCYVYVESFRKKPLSACNVTFAIWGTLGSWLMPAKEILSWTVLIRDLQCRKKKSSEIYPIKEISSGWKLRGRSNNHDGLSFTKYREKKRATSDGLIGSKEEIGHHMALATSAAPTVADENHNIASLFFSAVPENVTNCDNGKKAVHHSTTNLCTVNHDKEHTRWNKRERTGEEWDPVSRSTTLVQSEGFKQLLDWSPLNSVQTFMAPN